MVNFCLNIKVNYGFFDFLQFGKGEKIEVTAKTKI